MNITILNRDFQHPTDGWYQIEAKGDHPNRAAQLVQVIDEEAINTIVNRFNGDAKAGTLRHGSEMLIDHEHFSDQPDKETRAYGWLQELQNRADGIYGRIRWTATGKAAVDGGDYRFFSTEYEPQDLKVLNASGPVRRIRPTRLGGLSLTNMNNNRGQKPITNRNNLAGADASAVNQNPNEKNKTMKSIATKLGLAAEASEDAILAELTKLQNRITTLEPLEAENTTLKNRVAEFDSEQCASLLDLCGIKEERLRNRLSEGMKLLKNREERLGYLADFGHKPVEAKSDKGTQTRVLNRGEGRTASTDAATETDEQAIAQKAEAEIADYKIRNRCTYAEARNTVRMQKPELFGLKK